MSLSPPVYELMSPTSLKPYLELPHLLSLTWLAYPILSIIFVVFRLQIALGSSQDAASSAKADLLASCKAAEKAATAAASMPRYMALATNQQFADAVNGSMNAARAALVLSLTVMEAIINFIVDIYRSTFLCFLELVIRGGLSIIIAAVQEFNSVAQSAAAGLRTGIQDSINSANSGIQDLINTANKLGFHFTAPQISVPDLSSLENLTLPTTFQDALTQLNNTLPTFDDLKQKVESVIDTPFELLKKDINDTFTGLSFDAAVLPVPEQNTLSFCNDFDTSLVDRVTDDLVKITKIGTIILILLALLLIALNCLLEWYKWRCMKRHLQYTREAWSTDPSIAQSTKSGEPQITLTDHNLLMLQANSAHPLLTRIANTISARLHFSPSQHTHLSWFFHYIFHPPALACFIIGFFGLLSVQIQLAALGPITTKFSGQEAAVVSDFTNTIATSINTSMQNQSTTYATEINSRVDGAQSTINDGLFGWVNGTTTTLNDTIVGFYDDIQNAVSLVFNGTILDQPAQEFIRCIIGSKVDAIENALTFLHDNLNIDMPRVDNNVLMLSQSSIDEATRPIAAAAIGDGNGQDSGGIIARLVNAYVSSLKKERIMFLVFLGLWGLVVIMGLSVILWHSYGRQLVEFRKRRRYQNTQRKGIDGLVVPFRVGQPSPAESPVAFEKPTAHDLPSFTPLPSPKFSGGFNPFNRSASPSRLGSQETLQSKPEKPWNNFFTSKPDPRRRTISQPMKLLALGKGNGEEENKRSTAWFGRFATALSKKEPEPSIAPTRSGLRVEVPAPTNLRPEFPEVPRSRWSSSPETSQGWLRITSPKSESFSRPNPRMNAPVPSDVTSVYEQSALPASDNTPLAAPLYLGFENPSIPPQQKQRIPPSAIYYSPNRSLQPTKAPSRHQRASSVPYDIYGSTTPVTAENPFVTPFDDEHRVSVSYATARRSIPTNPFNPRV
ncbi:plasma membrane fusion protein PRM1 [Mycena floridula]|nr:plasma membrane fusion protein PRM1 [Mycena floridula]